MLCLANFYLSTRLLLFLLQLFLCEEWCPLLFQREVAVIKGTERERLCFSGTTTSYRCSGFDVHAAGWI